VNPKLHLALAFLSAYAGMWLGCYIFAFVDFPTWTYLPMLVTSAISFLTNVANIGWALHRNGIGL
jgi:hypothetical protein